MTSPAARSAPAAGAAYTPPKGALNYGMRGPAVRQLQQRLAFLHYYPGKADGQFGLDTLEAVWAFKEVQGIQTAIAPNDVTGKMKRALVHPRQPMVLVPKGGSWRIEVHLSLGYLVLYRHNVPELISHISPGGRLLLPVRWRSEGHLRSRDHPGRELPGALVRQRLGEGPAGHHVQPGVLHRRVVRHPR